jgi:hypothetical protein
MHFLRLARVTVLVALVGTLAACSGSGLGGLFGGRGAPVVQPLSEEELLRIENLNSGISREERAERARSMTPLTERRQVFGDLFRNRNGDTNVKVNRYLWNAALDVLNFLPVETVDPFSGVIVTGYGAPPGGGRAYRATVYISDPALDARSLKIAMQGRGGGAVSPETVRQIEDAILTRARQLRVRDRRL